MFTPVDTRSRQPVRPELHVGGCVHHGGHPVAYPPACTERRGGLDGHRAARLDRVQGQQFAQRRGVCPALVGAEHGEHARAHRPRRSTACTLAPARRRPHLPSSSGSRRRQALGRTSRSRWSSSTRSRATHATMRVRASLRAEPATRMVAPTRLTTMAPTAPPSPPLPSSRCREAKARLQGAAQAHHAHCCHPQEDST